MRHTRIVRFSLPGDLTIDPFVRILYRQRKDEARRPVGVQSRKAMPLLLLFAGLILFGGHGFSREQTVKLELERTAVLQPDDDVFDTLSGGAENGKGEVFLLDSKQFKVFRFSKEGRFLDSFGQKGEGPGDLKHPFSLMILGNDDIAVECFPYRLSLFKPEGAFYRLFNLHAVDNKISRAYTIGPDRWCVVRKGDNHTLSMVVCDFTGKVLDEPLYTIPDPAFRKSGMTINYRIEDTTPALLFARFGSFSACARNNEYRISLLDGNGRLAGTFSLPVKPQKLTKREIDSIERLVRKNFARIAANPGMKDVVDNAVKQILNKLPSEKNIMSRLMLSGKHLFVQRIADDISQSGTPIPVDVFALEGAYLGRADMEAWPLFCGRDAFYFLEEDREGDIHIVKMSYRILQDKG